MSRCNRCDADGSFNFSSALFEVYGAPIRISDSHNITSGWFGNLKKVWPPPPPRKVWTCRYFFGTFFLIYGECLNSKNALHIGLARLQDSFDHHCEFQSSIDCPCDRKLSLKLFSRNFETLELALFNFQSCEL